MNRIVLWGLAVWFLFLAGTMFLTPQFWYQSTPGVPEMGPFNMHFVRDIGLVFFASGAMIIYGLIKRDKTALLAGALWPCLHAVFHIYIWFVRGVPFDVIAFSNLFGIQFPAWLALFAGLKFERGATS